MPWKWKWKRDGWLIPSIYIHPSIKNLTNQSLIRGIHKHTGDENVGPILVCLPRPQSHASDANVDVDYYTCTCTYHKACTLFAGRNQVAAWKPHSRASSDATRFTVEFNIQDIKDSVCACHYADAPPQQPVPKQASIFLIDKIVATALSRDTLHDGAMNLPSLTRLTNFDFNVQQLLEPGEE
ncbi:hypothetical protein PAAG_00644 [Paracoccidioides lutzii Pb01]|uniref:Uncharacterized protein n=1 Tax=Paracoccidioides lutzii (strain ATCC MYA-826 / Pb01) TaxID=502779 RepID=C1GQ49_PARBA|nr:hypothetical protein PAAG_00644 [Paracoccidioides lutzii Pb01]EEH37723.2 hypothetical protein PAAG_00644 [Paracoccidioides lutzii Pb01]